jgi:2,4-dienoyl-CoA reductase (NADPH2)
MLENEASNLLKGRIGMKQRQKRAGEFNNLLSPLRVGVFELRNRVIMGSMHTRLESQSDSITKQATFYAERARGEVALVITGGYSPNGEGLLEPGGPRMDDSTETKALRPICDAVHGEGALICAQILHAGRYAKIENCVAPSSIRAPINRFVPRELTHDDIVRTISDFATAAANAQAAGFDGIEVMGSEGYLLNEFTVNHTNKRTDDWGGSVENRHRLPVEIVRAVRERCGSDFMIIYRISAADLIENGAPADEIALLAQKVEAAGADMLNTGIGWHEARVPTIAYPVPRGAWRHAAANVKNAVLIPVVASNRINTPELAEDIIASGEADLISMARPLLADPHFVRKTHEGCTEEINTCIACNQACLDYIFSERVAGCLVNPRAGRETEFRDAPAAVSKRIAVVGGGAAGMASATEAGRLGHNVTLFEASIKLGGQLNLARAAPGKAEFDETRRYFSAKMRKYGVTVKLGAPASVEDLSSGFDHVVIATGVTPRVPDLPGIDHPSVATYAQILSGERKAGPRVAVMGAGGIGFDVAEFLVMAQVETEQSDVFFANWGVDADFVLPGALDGDPLAPVRGSRAVTVLQRKTSKPGQTLGTSTGWILRNSLRKHGVTMLTGVTYNRIDNLGLHITLDDKPIIVEADTIVLCTGQEPVRALHQALAERGVLATMIGGAKDASELDALRAIDEGVRLAQTF